MNAEIGKVLFRDYTSTTTIWQTQGVFCANLQRGSLASSRRCALTNPPTTQRDKFDNLKRNPPWRSYRQRCEVRAETSFAKARYPDSQDRTPCFPPRPGYRTCRVICALDSVAKSTETRGREDNFEGLRPRDSAVPAGRNGKPWRGPTITFNQYVT
jgi:hypothetical protein